MSGLINLRIHLAGAAAVPADAQVHFERPRLDLLLALLGEFEEIRDGNNPRG
jgi:hypothetical protein